MYLSVFTIIRHYILNLILEKLQRVYAKTIWMRRMNELKITLWCWLKLFSYRQCNASKSRCMLNACCCFSSDGLSFHLNFSACIWSSKLIIKSHLPVSPLLPSAEANLLIKYRAFGSSSPISSFFCLLTCNFSYSIFPVDICIQIGVSLCSSVSSVLFLVEFLTTVLVMDSPLKSLVLYLRHLHSSLHHSGLHFFGLHHHNILFQVLFNMVTFDLVEFCWTFTNGNNQLR